MKPEDFLHHAEIGTPTIYVQYKGIFDMQDLYETIADFFRHKKFKFYERQQRLRKPGPFGPEIQYVFEAKRKVEEYYEWIINVNIETADMRDIEVVSKDGTKKKMSKGKIWIQIYGTVTTDYEKVWEKSAFLAHLKNFYNKYVIRKTYEGIFWDDMYYKIILRLHALIKERLNMTSQEERHHSDIH